MKRNHFIRLLFLLLLVGCTEDPLEFQGPPDFTVSHARTFFEKNATDLRGVRFGEEAMSRSTDYSNITPDWGSAEITQTGKITTVEIPLEGDACKIARTSRMTNSKALYGFTTRVTTKLVVQKHVEAETPRHFVVTMIDGLSQSLKKNEKSNCYGTSDFSGYVIVSSVTGEYLESFQSTNGCWTRVYMAPGTKEDLEDSRNVGIHMLGSDASPAAYNLGEDGISICSNCGNMLSMCTCCKLCGGKGCSECTVIVYPTCPKCRYTGPGAASGSCWCCSVCHNYPCTCYTAPDPDPIWICPKCGSRYCSGNCQTGGGANPGTGSTTTVAPQEDLSKKIFSNDSKLTKERWQKVEEVLNNINKDCMGGKMLGAMTNNSIKLIHDDQLSSNGRYNAADKTLRIKQFSNHDLLELSMLHELFHSQQPLNLQCKLNMEIEAHYIQWRYAMRNGVQIASSSIFGALQGVDDEFDVKYNYIGDNFNDTYEYLIQELRKNSAYNEQDYLESSSARNFNTARKFSSDCIK